MLRKSLLLLMFGLSTSGHLPAQWNLINPLPTNNNLNDMAFLNDSKGVAVGMNGTILTTSNGGDIWKTVPSQSFTNLNSVASPDSDAVFISADAED